MISVVWGGEACPEINDGIASFVANNIPGCERGFENYVTMGVIDGAKLIAGVVYHNWNPESQVIEFSVASHSKLWLTRPVLREMFSYPFNQLGCQMLVVRVSELNTHLIRICKAYGFQGHKIPRLRGRHEAEFIFTLTDDDWRSSRFNQRQVQHG